MTHNKLKTPKFFKNMFTTQVLSQKFNKLPITSTDLEVVPCIKTDGRTDIATSMSAMWMQAVRWANPLSSLSSKMPWPSWTITSALHFAGVCPGTQGQQSCYRTAYQQVSNQAESSRILFRLHPVLGNVITLSGPQTKPPQQLLGLRCYARNRKYGWRRHVTHVYEEKIMLTFSLCIYCAPGPIASLCNYWDSGPTVSRFI